MERDRNFFDWKLEGLKGKNVSKVKRQANDVTMALINWNNHVINELIRQNHALTRLRE